MQQRQLSPTVQLRWAQNVVDGGLRATALIINRDGTVAGFQDKVQIPMGEEGVYSPGFERRIFESGALKFGVVICHEVPSKSVDYQRTKSSTNYRRISRHRVKLAGEISKPVEFN